MSENDHSEQNEIKSFNDIIKQRWYGKRIYQIVKPTLRPCSENADEPELTRNMRE